MSGRGFDERVHGLTRRRIHGATLTSYQAFASIEPIVAMLQALIGHYPTAKALRELRDRIMADPLLREIWSALEIASPLLPSTCTIMSPGGFFTYETLTL